MEYRIRNFEVSQQAVAVLAYLMGDWYIEDVNTYTYCHTAAWYNGRERGFSITVSMLRNENLIVTFGECRNSDGIFVDHWQGKPDINPPTVQDFSDEIYARRKYFNWGDAAKAADYVRDLIEQYIKES